MSSELPKARGHWNTPLFERRCWVQQFKCCLESPHPILEAWLCIPALPWAQLPASVPLTGSGDGQLKWLGHLEWSSRLLASVWLNPRSHLHWGVNQQTDVLSFFPFFKQIKLSNTFLMPRINTSEETSHTSMPTSWVFSQVSRGQDFHTWLSFLHTTLHNNTNLSHCALTFSFCIVFYYFMFHGLWDFPDPHPPLWFPLYYYTVIVLRNQS